MANKKEAIKVNEACVGAHVYNLTYSLHIYVMIYDYDFPYYSYVC